MSTPNIPLLRKMVEWVEEQEARTENREWYQGWWISDRPTIAEDSAFDVGHFCDTAYCVAGKVAVDAGWLPVSGIGLYVHKGTRMEMECVTDVAKDLLGVSDDEAEALFAGYNTAADIRQIAEDIAGERL